LTAQQGNEETNVIACRPRTHDIRSEKELEEEGRKEERGISIQYSSAKPRLKLTHSLYVFVFSFKYLELTQLSSQRHSTKSDIISILGDAVYTRRGEIMAELNISE
jgi:hypothetical protein